MSVLAVVPEISLFRLGFSLLPVIAVLMLMAAWSRGLSQPIWGIARMLVQLMLIGYVLKAVISGERISVVALMLLVMWLAASWISLRAVGRTLADQRAQDGARSDGENHRLTMKRMAFAAVVSIGLSGFAVLAIVTQLVLRPDPWFAPGIVIPLAGMLLANCMNAVSLAAERFVAELQRREVPAVAKLTAFGASMIPITNSLFAVGLVSIPGMMTGQVLSGADPVHAARYQIMVMCMIFGSGGLASGLFLTLIEKDATTRTVSRL